MILHNSYRSPENLAHIGSWHPSLYSPSWSGVGIIFYGMMLHYIILYNVILHRIMITTVCLYVLYVLCGMFIPFTCASYIYII